MKKKTDKTSVNSEKDNDENPDQQNVPEVSKERFYKVETSLKSLFGSSNNQVSN